jgi:1-acyl-sn-glycerol-3-phosphate acyltransferase
MKEKSYSFLIFPEGTRSRHGKLQDFRRGGFFLAATSQSPIIPVSILGTYELMPKGQFIVKKGKIKVVFHAPISIEGYQKDNLPILMDKVRDAIQSGISETERDESDEFGSPEGEKDEV